MKPKKSKKVPVKVDVPPVEPELEDPNPDDIEATWPPPKKRGRFWEFILKLIDRAPMIVKTLQDTNVIKTKK